jgi:predicted XRE-type DNA-binding protein
MPKDGKPFKGVASGVLEIAIRYATDAYRVVLAAQIGKLIIFCTPFKRNQRKGLQRRNAACLRSDTQKHLSWSMGTKKPKVIKFQEGSGNVFADLRLKDSVELYARAQIGADVFRILNDKNLKQREIAILLGIAQPDVSHLMNGHFSRFTTDKLLDFLKRLGQKVTIEVSPRHKGEAYQQVIFAP